jgi:hypothetical protein
MDRWIDRWMDAWMDGWMVFFFNILFHKTHTIGGYFIHKICKKPKVITINTVKTD